MKSLLSQKRWRLGLVTLAVCTITILCGCGLLNKNPVITSVQSQKEWVELSGNNEVKCVASDPDGDALAYHWTATGGDISGQNSTITWTAPDAPGTYTITVNVTDGRGGEATGKLSMEVQVNHPPVIESLIAEQLVVKPGESTPTMTECVASDPDGDELVYQWTATGGDIFGQDSTITWTAPHNPGTYIISVRVTDGRGGEATEKLNIEVRTNHPPVIQSLTAERLVVTRYESVYIGCAASDPDGDELAYRWTANGGDISGQDSIATWTASCTSGTYTITVMVTDGRGGKASAEVDIRVRSGG